MTASSSFTMALEPEGLPCPSVLAVTDLLCDINSLSCLVNSIVQRDRDLMCFKLTMTLYPPSATPEDGHSMYSQQTRIGKPGTFHLH